MLVLGLAAVLNARPEVNFVLHSHTRAGIAVSSYPGGLLPLFFLYRRNERSAHRFGKGVGREQEGRRRRADLGICNQIP